MRKIKNLLDLHPNFDVFVFDLWGTLWDGNKFIGNALETLLKLRCLKKKVILISNSSELEENIKKDWASRGLTNRHYDDIFSSGGYVRKQLLKRQDAINVCFVGEPVEQVFGGLEKVNITKNLFDVDVFILGRPRVFQNGFWQPQLDIESFKKALDLCMMLDKTFWCVNPDLETPAEGFDVPVAQNGALAQYCEQKRGEVLYYGKPAKEIFYYALSGCDKARTVVIGDILETDVQGGNLWGAETVLTCSGLSAYHARLDGLDIEEYILRKNILPSFIIDSL